MYTTTAAIPAARSHDFELPYTTAELEDHVAQRDLDRECAELREAADYGLEAAASALAEAAGTNAVTGDRLYTQADVLGWIADAEGLGAATPNIGPKEIEDVFRGTRIPNAKLRAEYLRRVEEEGEEGLLALISRALGQAQPDTTYVQRFLGLALTRGKARKSGAPGERYPDTVRLFVSAERAAACAVALDLDFHDLGI